MGKWKWEWEPLHRSSGRSAGRRGRENRITFEMSIHKISKKKLKENNIIPMF